MSQNEWTREHIRVGRNIQIVSARPYQWILDTQLMEILMEAYKTLKKMGLKHTAFFFMIPLTGRAKIRKTG